MALYDRSTLFSLGYCVFGNGDAVSPRAPRVGCRFPARTASNATYLMQTPHLLDVFVVAVQRVLTRVTACHRFRLCGVYRGQPRRPTCSEQTHWAGPCHGAETQGVLTEGRGRTSTSSVNSTPCALLSRGRPLRSPEARFAARPRLVDRARCVPPLPDEPAAATPPPSPSTDARGSRKRREDPMAPRADVGSRPERAARADMAVGSAGQARLERPRRCACGTHTRAPLLHERPPTINCVLSCTCAPARQRHNPIYHKACTCTPAGIGGAHVQVKVK